MAKFWLAFVPLFVAIDPLGTIPMFLTLTEGLDNRRRRKAIYQSILTAMLVALVFLAIGKSVLDLLGVGIADFMIAGGTLLFILSVTDMITVERRKADVDPESVGAVPLGVPLIIGPAALTTIILLLNQFGPLLTILSVVLNIVLAGVTFFLSGIIDRTIGKTGARILAKLANLLLAAIAVMMVRRGLETVILHLRS